MDTPAEESTDWWINDQANLLDNWYGNLGDATAAGGGDTLAGGLSPAQVHEIYVGGGDGGYRSLGSIGTGYKYGSHGVNGGI